MRKKTIRYAVVGQGHIAQIAVLPGFNQTNNSKVTALVSGDSSKLKLLSKKYNIPDVYSYDQFEDCLNSGEIDAVYITLPNHLHKEYALRAAHAGIHVICEKPLAINAKDCETVIKVARRKNVKLMVAYRLHFDPGTLKAIQIANSGKIGELKYITLKNSVNSKTTISRSKYQTPFAFGASAY